MVYVIDDALDEASRAATIDYFLSLKTVEVKPKTKTNWADGTYKQILDYGSPLAKILEHAKQAIDLDLMVGCEYWANIDTKTGWHKDTDERLLYSTGKEQFPICSCVYYAEVNNLIGGDLVFETLRISPVVNRLVIFSPNLLHVVEDFSGARMSVAVNPWQYKLEPICQ